MEPLKIGNITLPHRAVFGPMAGFTDAPCRRLMAQHGAGFTVSEMVSSRALVYHDHKTVSLLKAEPNGAPYGVQIFGEVPEIMGEAAAAIEAYPFDFLDINMGCPAPKIVSGGAGSKLMLDPDLCGRIVEQVKAHTSRPVTVKMRKGWDADHITAVECAKACEQAGAQLIAVHARTREQMYAPGIDPDIIAKVKAAVKVPVLGNGDIHTAEDAVEMMARTGCDGVMIARGALGDPWLFERVNAAIEGLPAPQGAESAGPDERTPPSGGGDGGAEGRVYGHAAGPRPDHALYEGPQGRCRPPPLLLHPVPSGRSGRADRGSIRRAAQSRAGPGRCAGSPLPVTPIRCGSARRGSG